MLEIAQFLAQMSVLILPCKSRLSAGYKVAGNQIDIY
jgi:hypothetical protein